MTRAEATKRAESLWADGFALRRPDARRHMRFVVGYVGETGPFPLGWGASYEEAFASAESRGLTAEVVKQKREQVKRRGDRQSHARVHGERCLAMADRTIAEEAKRLRNLEAGVVDV